MKKLSVDLGLFILIAVGLAFFTACDKPADSSNSAADETAKSGSPAASPAVKEDRKSEGFPPVPEAIMNAEIKAIDGSTFQIADLKGKVVLINLWATWCGPCRSEMPELVELQNKYGDQGLEVIGLDTDENETVEQIKDFAAEMKLNYKLGWADPKFFSEFVKLTRQPAIPQSMLINRNGRMTGLFTGAGIELMEKMKATVEKTVAE